MNIVGEFCARRGRVAILIAAFLTFGALAVHGQEITGRLLGSVVDSSGAAVPNAAVTITNQNTGVVRNTATTSDGLYTDPQVPAGTYTVAAMAPGFSPSEVTNVLVTVGSDTRVDLKVAVGSVSQAVTVTEAIPQVNTTSSENGGTVNEQKVADLPLNGRNWTDLTLLQAGITQSRLITVGTTVQGANGLMFSSSGAPLWSNMFTIDGASMIAPTGLNNSSLIGTSLGVDGIQEYKVVTSMFGAQYGLVMGSQTTIVSKGGTNQFHGDMFEYLRNSALDARNPFDAIDTQNDNGFGATKSLPYAGKRLPPFRRNNFGGAFGGPIRKDKTFFWATYEGLRQQTGLSIATVTIPKACFYDQNDVLHATVPQRIDNKTTNPAYTAATNTACAGAAGTTIGTGAAPGTINVTNASILGLADLFPQPNVVGYATLNYTFPFIQPASENYGQMRIDQNFSAKDNAFARYTQDDSDETTTISNNAYPNFHTTFHSASQFATLGESHVFSTALLNTFRFSFSRTVTLANSSSNPSLVNSPVDLVQNQDFGSVTPAGTGLVGSSTSITAFANGAPSYEYGNDFQYSDDVFWTKGKHAFKFGTLFAHHVDDFTLAASIRGSATFSSLTNFFLADYSNITQAAATTDEHRHFHSNTLGFYAQDDFRIAPRVTLNLGLRYEFETVPTVPANQSYYVPNIATATPPFGVPGPLWKNPSLLDFSPRVGFAWDVTGRGTTSVRGGGGIYYDVGNHGSKYIQVAEGTPPISSFLITNNTLPTPVIPFSTPLPLGSQTVSPRLVDDNIRQPRIFQYNLTVDRQLPWNMALTVGYVGSRGNHLDEIIEGNPTVPKGIGPSGLPYYCSPASGSGGAPTAANPCAANATFPGRNNPNFSQVVYVTAGGDSWYNALQIALNKQISRGFQFQATYTWAKLLDDGETQLTAINDEVVQATPGENWDDKGPAAFDVASNARINLIYHAPGISPDRFASKILNGWWFGSILAAQSGYPVTPILGSDRALQNNQQVLDRPNLDPSFNKATATTGNPNGWFNVSMFDVPPAGTLGNEPRAGLRGPGLLNLDFSVNKDWKFARLGEAGAVQFRMEVFNIINHANYSNPNTTIWLNPSGSVSTNPQGGQLGAAGSGALFTAPTTAGQITTTATNSRQIQFALKVIF